MDGMEHRHDSLGSLPARLDDRPASPATSSLNGFGSKQCPIERAEIVANLFRRYVNAKDSVEESTRRQLLMIEDLEGFDNDVLRVAVKEAVRLATHGMPTPGEIIVHAKEERAHRRIVAPPKPAPALSAPATYAKPEDTAAILAECYAKLDAGHRKLTGRSIPGTPAAALKIHAGPPRMPTAAELAEFRTPAPEGGISDDMRRYLAQADAA